MLKWWRELIALEWIFCWGEIINVNTSRAGLDSDAIHWALSLSF